jgi:hypothetical protein
MVEGEPYPSFVIPERAVCPPCVVYCATGKAHVVLLRGHSTCIRRTAQYQRRPAGRRAADVQGEQDAVGNLQLTMNMP